MKAAPTAEALAAEDPAIARARLAAIVENTDDGVVSKTLDGIVQSWNQGAERIFGWKAEEIIGRPIHLVIPPERRDEEAEILARLRRGERIDHFETVRVRKDGERLDVSVTISPIRDEAGRVVAAAKIARDISAQKRAQRLLEQARREAERATRAKDQFLSTLSHELRAPLAPVLTTLGFLEETAGLSEKVRAHLSMIRRNIETEVRLVDDLLDVTRIQHGKLQITREPVDLHHSVRTVVEMLQSQLDRKSIRLRLDLQARVHRISADPVRIQQILLNLLSNAIKFSAAGSGISIHTANLNNGSKIRLEFRDQGIGIEPELLPRLFQPFEQGRSLPRSGGLGLGLSIARNLARMHDGDLEAASEGTGNGSTFMLSLPTSVETSTVAATPAAAGARKANGLRVLLVEDHADTREAMTLLLGALGCTVVGAGTAREAIAAGESQPFDMMLSDLALPDGSGIEVMQRLRSTPIHGIALTGFGQEDTIAQSREAGFERHITKPVTFQRLRELILEYADSKQKA